MCRIAVGGAGEIALQCRLAAAAYTPEQIEFVRCRTQSDIVAAADISTVQAALARAVRIGGKRGQEVVALDHILFAVDFAVQYGCTQTGIALECDVDQLLQARVGKIVMPT
ncbi:Uncharacterised protein [Neisseria meningitidis]|nr:Uncharacterised protein [Neisseria meningitidis]